MDRDRARWVGGWVEHQRSRNEEGRAVVVVVVVGGGGGESIGHFLIVLRI